VKNIKEATDDSIYLVYDTISEDSTYSLVLDSIPEGKPAKISHLIKPNPKIVEKRKDVKWLRECPRCPLYWQFPEYYCA